MWHSAIQQEGPAKGDKKEHQEGRGSAWQARRHTCSEVEGQKRGENAHHCPRPLRGVKEEEDPTDSWWLPGYPEAILCCPVKHIHGKSGQERPVAVLLRFCTPYGEVVETPFLSSVRCSCV